MVCWVSAVERSESPSHRWQLIRAKAEFRAHADHMSDYDSSLTSRRWSGTSSLLLQMADGLVRSRGESCIRELVFGVQGGGESGGGVERRGVESCRERKTTRNNLLFHMLLSPTDGRFSAGLLH